MATTSSYSVGILTISDRCSRGEAEDKSGPKLVQTIKELSNATSNVNWTVTRQAIIPDEKDIIKKRAPHPPEINKKENYFRIRMHLRMIKCRK